MSDFGSITIVMQHPVTESVTTTLPASKVSRMWHKLTRKPLPTITQDIPHTHTVTVDEYADAERLARTLTHSEEYGYEFVSVQVEDAYGTTELTGEYRGNPHSAEIMALFEGVSQDEYRYAAYVAYIMENGWDSYLDSSRMDDIFQGEYESSADYAREFVTDCYDLQTPDFISIDWEETADNMGQDSSYVRHNGSTFVFWNH